MQEFINNKILPKIMKFVNTRGILAIKDGVVQSIPFIIVGSIFLLLSNFPWLPVVDFWDQMGWLPIMNQAYECSFNIMSLVSVVSITYYYVKYSGFVPLPASLISLSVFLIVQPGSILNQAGEEVSVI